MVAVLLVDSFRSMMGTARYVATTGYKESLHLVEIVDLDVLLSAIMSVFDVNTNGVFHLYTGVLNYLERPIFYCGIGTLFFIPQAIILARKKEKTLIGTGIIAVALYMMFPFITDIFNLFIKNEELGARSYRLSSIWIIIVMVMIGGYGLHCCNFIEKYGL